MDARLFSPVQLKPFTLQQRVVSRALPVRASTMAENLRAEISMEDLWQRQKSV
jgi:hypothetical protein